MSVPFDFEVIVLDPCLLNIATVTQTLQINPPNYYYTATDLTWSVNPPYTANYNCPIVYTCNNIMSPIMPSVVDMCSVSQLDTKAQFDSVGIYTLNTIDIALCPPGEYIFEITGAIGLQTASTTFVATLINPCLTTPLTINDPDPFNDYIYKLQDAPII